MRKTIVVFCLVCGVCCSAGSVVGQDTPEASPAEVSAPPVAEAASESAVTAQSAAVPAAKPVPVVVEVEVPFSLQPYIVDVQVSFESGCLNDASQRNLLVEDIQKAVERMFGRMWQPQIAESDWFVSGDSGGLGRIQLSDMLERYPEDRVHKAFIVTIEQQGSGYQVSCREYDSRVQELTPVYSASLLDVRGIGSTAVELIRDAFRPCVLFVRNFTTEDGQALMELHVQAGEILPPDPSAEQVVEGDVLRPFIRQMDRRNPKKLSQLRAMTLSYVKVLRMGPTEVPSEPGNQSEDEFPAFTVLNDDGTVAEADVPIDSELGRSIVTGIYLTHMSYSPFGGKGRRMQHLALRQRPTASESRVKLVLQSRPDKPLISHRMALAYQLGYRDEEDGPQTQLVSDRNGEVTIKVKEGHPTFWIRVYSGASLLARVPYAAGLIPYDVVELPDDSIRLGVEGEIQLLSDKLIDSIALRGVLLARARKAAEAGSTDEVDQLLEKYDGVPAKAYFLEKVSNIRNLAEKQAKERRQSASRITKLCTGLSDTVSTFFSDEKRAERTEEILKIRQSAEQNAK
ncbi:MAG: hypothetical protein WBH50_06255 [Fuerstiella sp.]